MVDHIFVEVNTRSPAMEQQIAEADIGQPLHADGAYTGNVQEAAYKIIKSSAK